MILPIYQNLSEKLEKYIADNGITGRMPGVLKLSRELGVHHVTLSKAMRILEKKGVLSINGTKGTFVHESSVKRPKHHVIALVGADAEQVESKEILTRLNEAARRSGYHVIGITFEEGLYQRNKAILLNFPVDGFLFRMSSLRREQAELLRREEFPMVSGARKEGYPWLDQTDCDHHAGYSLLLDRLLALGHRRIAFLEFDRVPEYRFYLNNIRRVFEEKLGDAFDPDLFYAKERGRDLLLEYGEDYWEIYPERALKFWFALPEPPTAVIAPLPLLIRIDRFLEKMKIKVPQNVSLMLVSSSGKMEYKKFSGIVYDEYDMLLWGLHCLLDRLNGKVMEPQHYFQKPVFHEGASVGKAPEKYEKILNKRGEI
ncbi:MAG: hypothetical protein BWY31_00035 [Lentisphaerae bacterium ADurb.Bin242]|nr:MAG: hypothetical protein BWY31_00035 [Lentisphaerae bacterium ADurb.Bin242]